MTFCILVFLLTLRVGYISIYYHKRRKILGKWEQLLVSFENH